MSFSIFFITTFIIYNRAFALQENYYWREFKGVVPADAVVGGHDDYGDDVYIGQAYVSGVGLIVAHIWTDVKEVYVAFNRKVEEAEHVKILCGPQENFYWLPTTSVTLQQTLKGRHAVIGGHIDRKGETHIGRITRRSETQIGRILSYQKSKGQAYFVFNDDGKEAASIESYEVLLYKNSTVNPTSRPTPPTTATTIKSDIDAEIEDIFKGL